MIRVWVRYAVDVVLPWRQGTSRLLAAVVYWTWRHQTTAPSSPEWRRRMAPKLTSRRCPGRSLPRVAVGVSSYRSGFGHCHVCRQANRIGWVVERSAEDHCHAECSCRRVCVAVARREEWKIDGVPIDGERDSETKALGRDSWEYGLFVLRNEVKMDDDMDFRNGEGCRKMFARRHADRDRHLWRPKSRAPP